MLRCEYFGLKMCLCTVTVWKKFLLIKSVLSPHQTSVEWRLLIKMYFLSWYCPTLPVPGFYFDFSSQSLPVFLSFSSSFVFLFLCSLWLLIGFTSPFSPLSSALSVPPVFSLLFMHLPDFTTMPDCVSFPATQLVFWTWTLPLPCPLYDLSFHVFFATIDQARIMSRAKSTTVPRAPVSRNFKYPDITFPRQTHLQIMTSKGSCLSKTQSFWDPWQYSNNRTQSSP